MAEAPAKTEVDKVKTCLDILRHSNPLKMEHSMQMLSMAFLDEEEELTFCGRVDLPLKVQKPAGGKKPFISCDYNRDGDSFRSPWDNEYFPPIEEEDYEPLKPDEWLRNLETTMNSVVQVYRHQYFSKQGVSNAYCWAMDTGGSNQPEKRKFGCCVVISKDFEAAETVGNGTWNSMHVVSCQPDGDSTYSYECIGSLILEIKKEDKGIGNLSIAGSVSAMENLKNQKVHPDHRIDSHVQNIGKLIEDLESGLRRNITSQYMGKCNMIQQAIRHPDAEKASKQKNMANMAMAAMMKKKKKQAEA